MRKLCATCYKGLEDKEYSRNFIINVCGNCEHLKSILKNLERRLKITRNTIENYKIVEKNIVKEIKRIKKIVR